MKGGRRVSWSQGPCVAALAACLVFAGPASGGLIGDILDSASGKRDEDRFVAGLKEALDIGTRNAVEAVSVRDGYFGRPAIRIPVPGELEKAENLLRKIGMGDRVDAFILSMNRAAEAAAPGAARIFLAALRDMTVLDAYGIVTGPGTAATKYFRDNTYFDLYSGFRPVIADSMASAGVVRSYRRMMKKYNSLPLVRKVEVDLEDYVTRRALDGLFHMLAEEEKKIRSDPAARVTDLLRDVFGD